MPTILLGYRRHRPILTRQRGWSPARRHRNAARADGMPFASEAGLRHLYQWCAGKSGRQPDPDRGSGH